MSLNVLLPDSMVNNGQLLGMKQAEAYNPNVFGPFYQGSVSPVPSAAPSQMGTAQMPIDNANVSGNASLAQHAAMNPWSPSASPLIWVIGALIVGLLGLRYVHWG